MNVAPEPRGVADLPSEALAVVREQGARGVATGVGFIFVGLLAAVFGGVAAELLDRSVRGTFLVIEDTLGFQQWNPVVLLAMVAGFGAALALATSGPYIATWHRRTNALHAVLKTCLLALPDGACALILVVAFDRGELLLSYHDAPIVRLVIAGLWLGASAVVFPLAPAVIFFEPSPGLRPALRRARELARGRVGLVLCVRLVPLLVLAGGVFQLVESQHSRWRGQLGVAAVIFGAFVVAASPIIAGLLGVAGYRIAVTSEPAREEEA